MLGWTRKSTITKVDIALDWKSMLFDISFLIKNQTPKLHDATIIGRAAIINSF